MKYLWKENSFVKYICYVFCSTLLIPHFESSVFMSYIILLYIVVFLTFLIYFIIIYVYFNFKNKSRKGIACTFLQIISEIFLSTLFLPFLDVLLVIFKCETNKNNVLTNAIYKDIICFKGNYIAHTLMSSLTIILFLFFSFAVAFFYFECRFNPNSFNSK